MLWRPWLLASAAALDDSFGAWSPQLMYRSGDAGADQHKVASATRSGRAKKTPRGQSAAALLYAEPWKGTID